MPDPFDFLPPGMADRVVADHPDLFRCDHIGTPRVRRTGHGALNDKPAGTIELLCGDCGAELPESDCCDHPMCERAATVTLTYIATDASERLCRIHASEVLA